MPYYMCAYNKNTLTMAVQKFKSTITYHIHRIIWKWYFTHLWLMKILRCSQNNQVVLCRNCATPFQFCIHDPRLFRFILWLNLQEAIGHRLQRASGWGGVLHRHVSDPPLVVGCPPAHVPTASSHHLLPPGDVATPTCRHGGARAQVQEGLWSVSEKCQVWENDR